MPTTAATTLAEGPRAAWCSTARSPRPRSSCSASTSSTARRSTRRSRSPRELARASSPAGAYEIRPICACSGRESGVDVTDIAWIDAALTLGASPGGRRAAALFPRPRHRRGGVPGGLPARAEELAAERPAARSRRLADLRRPQRRPRRGAAPQQAASRCRRRTLISDLDDAEAALAERLDGAHYRDDVLRLLFICCHPELPATQQIALALRIVSGLSVKQIARAFLVERERHGAAHHARQGAASPRPTCRSRRRAPVERAERLAAVAAMIYLVFNEGYSASGGERRRRAPLCEEAIRLARLLLRLFPTEPEIMGLTALLLLQHARAPARFDADGAIVLLEDQDRSLWNREMIAEGLALIDKAMRHRRPGPTRCRRRSRRCMPARARPEDTDWAEIDLLYATLERLQPSPVVTLNRAVAVAKVRGPAAALAMIEPLAPTALRLFPLLRRQGRAAACSSAAPRRRASPSTARSRSPTPPPRPRTSACISTA